MQVSERGWAVLERFFKVPKITSFNCSCKILMRKSKSASCFDRWSLVGSWLSQEPGWRLGWPSKQEREQLKGSSYTQEVSDIDSLPVGERKGVGQRRWWREGQRRKDSDKRVGGARNKWSRMRPTGHSCQVAWSKEAGASRPWLCGTRLEPYFEPQSINGNLPTQITPCLNGNHCGWLPQAH